MKIGDIKQYEIDKLNLSTKAGNCLIEAGIYTVQQIKNMEYKDLLRIPNIGKHTADEILFAIGAKRPPVKKINYISLCSALEKALANEQAQKQYYYDKFQEKCLTEIMFHEASTRTNTVDSGLIKFIFCHGQEFLDAINKKGKNDAAIYDELSKYYFSSKSKKS
jgi:hypothetical protein